MDLRPHLLSLFVAAAPAYCGAPRLEAEGSLRTELLSATVAGSAAADSLYATESGQGSALDLSLRYRPSQQASAAAEVRFYQDWRALPEGKGSVAALRRLNVEARAGQTLAFQAGDFRRRLTPLTLWAPAPELIEEPELFARRREEVMGERLLDLPDRNLQGAEIRYDRQVPAGPGYGGFLTAFGLHALGSRIRRAEYLDADGAQGWGLDRADMDRFHYGLSPRLIIRRHLSLGGGAWRLADDRSTYETLSLGPETRKAVFGDAPNAGTSLNGRDSAATRSLDVTGLHGTLDLAGFLGKPDLVLAASAEWAAATERSRRAWEFRVDTVAGKPKNVPFSRPLPGSRGEAARIELRAGGRNPATGSRWQAHLAWLATDAAFLNPMAQSPAFAPARILNSENDGEDGRLYSTFDALYHGVYRFAPGRRGNRHQRAPYEKNAWQGGVRSPEDLRAFAAAADPVVQLELPLGPATPDRQGYAGRLEGDWHGITQVTLAGALLAEARGTAPADTAGLPAAARAPVRHDYRMAAAGLRLEAHRLAGALPPLTLNGSATIREKAPRRVPGHADSVATRVRLLMAGARLQVAPKWALLAGWQEARVVIDSAAVQSHWRAGVEYALGRSAYVHLSAGRIRAEGAFTQSLLQAVILARF